MATLVVRKTGSNKKKSDCGQQLDGFLAGTNTAIRGRWLAVLSVVYDGTWTLQPKQNYFMKLRLPLFFALCRAKEDVRTPNSVRLQRLQKQLREYASYCLPLSLYDETNMRERGSSKHEPARSDFC